MQKSKLCIPLDLTDESEETVGMQKSKLAANAPAHLTATNIPCPEVAANPAPAEVGIHDERFARKTNKIKNERKKLRKDKISNNFIDLFYS